jgi:hypothetical protein
MILPYLTEGFIVPAPAVKVQIVNPETKAKESWIARIDYGADITVIPFAVMEKLRLNIAGSTFTSGYDDPGREQMLFSCTLQLRSLRFSGIDVIATSTTNVLIGLDILNTLHICLDGEKKKFEIIEKRASARPRSRR